jgi:hypothetical protein
LENGAIIRYDEAQARLLVLPYGVISHTTPR